MPSSVPLDEPQPSQLYIDVARLDAALDWFDVDDPTYDPVPVLYLEDDLVLTDGHTRAFLAFLAGDTTLDVVRDPDRKDLNTALYQECVDWCREESITQIADLAGRLVSQTTFQEKWIKRCQSSSLYREE